MDDGGVISGEKNLVAIWNILLEETPKLCLELNPSKCEWSWLDPNCTKPCPIRVPGDEIQQIELVPRDEIQMLGVPLGSDEKAAAYVEKKLMCKLKSMVDRLADLDDIQSALFLLNLLQHCACDTFHAFRKWAKVAEQFDKQIWDATQNIMALQIPEQAWKQACLTPGASVCGESLTMLRSLSRRVGMRPRPHTENHGQPVTTRNGLSHKNLGPSRRMKTS